MRLVNNPAYTHAQSAYVRHYSGSNEPPGSVVVAVVIVVHLIYATSGIIAWHAFQPEAIPEPIYKTTWFASVMLAMLQLIGFSNSVKDLSRMESFVSSPVNRHIRLHAWLSRKIIPDYCTSERPHHRLIRVEMWIGGMMLVTSMIMDGWLLGPMNILALSCLTYACVRIEREEAITAIQGLTDDQIREIMKIDRYRMFI